MSYSSVLHDGTTHEGLFGGEAPQLTGDSLSWTANSLACSFAMRRRASAYAATLFDSVEGHAIWNCHMPAADVTVQMPSRELRGRGYAEVLELSVPPWRLPITELRWGRCTGSELSLVWIDWKGAHPLSVILRNGACVSGSVSDGAVVADDVILSTCDGAVVRAATIGDTVAAIPLLKFIVPDRFLNAVETKWSARGTMRRGSEIVDRGWTLHEVVRFA